MRFIVDLFLEIRSSLKKAPEHWGHGSVSMVIHWYMVVHRVVLWESLQMWSWSMVGW